MRALQKITQKIIDKEIIPDEINEAIIAETLDTAHQPYPDPDIVIRTSGEKRTSGLLPWQAAYTEYFFLDKYFPDITNDDIDEILEEYSNRQRRFGK